MKEFETQLVCKDENGDPVSPYNYTSVHAFRWERGGKVSRSKRKHGFTKVSNDLPEGFAEAIDIPGAWD